MGKLRKKVTKSQPARKKTPRELSKRILDFQRNKLKIDAPSRPVDGTGKDQIPIIPPDITKLPDQDLGRLQGCFSAWANYLEHELAVAEVDKLELDERDLMTSATTRIQLHGTETAQWRTDSATLDETAARVRQKRLEKKAFVKLLQARLSGCERAIKVLSREQTRRDNERNRRDE